jgi:hypothetical protein
MELWVNVTVTHSAVLILKCAVNVTVICRECVSASVCKFVLGSNRDLCFVLGIYCRVVKVCCSVTAHHNDR